MEIVSVQHNFNMQWCLDCHHKPEMRVHRLHRLSPVGNDHE